MSGYEVLTPSAGSTDWTSFNTQVTYQRKGFMEINLNNYDTTGTPSIAAGGLVEVAGALFYFGDTEAISGSASTANLNYIRVSASSSSITPEYTTNAPVWVASKNGYYNSTTGLLRYIGGCEKDKGGKWIYTKPENHKYVRVSGSLRQPKRKRVNIGDWDMDTGSPKYISLASVGVTGTTNIINIAAFIRNDANTQTFPLEFFYGAAPSGYIYISTSDIVLQRTGSGIFDGTDFNATSYNRGWVEATWED